PLLSPSFLYTAPSPTDIYTLSLHDALPISFLDEPHRISDRLLVRRLVRTERHVGDHDRPLRAPGDPLRHEHDLVQGHGDRRLARSEEHTSELQSRSDLVCRLLLEKKKKNTT